MGITHSTEFLGAIPSYSIHTPQMPLTKGEKFNRVIYRAYCQNYRFSLLYNFSTSMVKSISALKPRYFRIHVLGKFYSQEYFNKWCGIAEEVPLTIFYTYVDQDIILTTQIDKRPKNFKIIFIKQIHDQYSGDLCDNTVIMYNDNNRMLCPKYLRDTPCKLCMACIDQTVQLKPSDWNRQL